RVRSHARQRADLDIDRGDRLASACRRLLLSHVDHAHCNRQLVHNDQLHRADANIALNIGQQHNGQSRRCRDCQHLQKLSIVHISPPREFFLPASRPSPWPVRSPPPPVRSNPCGLPVVLRRLALRVRTLPAALVWACRPSRLPSLVPATGQAHERQQYSKRAREGWMHSQSPRYTTYPELVRVDTRLSKQTRHNPPEAHKPNRSRGFRNPSPQHLAATTRASSAAPLARRIRHRPERYSRCRQSVFSYRLHF